MKKYNFYFVSYFFIVFLLMNCVRKKTAVTSDHNDTLVILNEVVDSGNYITMDPIDTSVSIPHPTFQAPNIEPYNKKPTYNTPSKYIHIVFENEVHDDIFIFYYSPTMEQRNYPYRKIMGSDNNLIGFSNHKEKSIVGIPDTIDPGAKLMFRSIGLEPLDICIDEMIPDNLIRVKLMPKTYTSIVTLSKTDANITASLSNEQPKQKTFYGECNPIYDEDGLGHGDPICAFSCLACCYPEFIEWQIKEVLTASDNEIPELYNALEKGEECSLMFIIERNKIRVEFDTLPAIALEKFKQAVRNTDWRIQSDGMKMFKHRMTFTIKEKNSPSYLINLKQ